MALALAATMGVSSSALAKKHCDDDDDDDDDGGGGGGGGNLPTNAVILEHFMVIDGNFGLIIPCVKVIRRFWTRAQTDRSLVVEITVTYQSRLEMITRTFEVPLGDFFLSDHHPQPKQRKFRLLEAELDVSDLPVDEGTIPTGTATLIRLSAAA